MKLLIPGPKKRIDPQDQTAKKEKLQYSRRMPHTIYDDIRDQKAEGWIDHGNITYTPRKMTNGKL
jgi:hypothetical protein